MDPRERYVLDVNPEISQELKNVVSGFKLIFKYKQRIMNKKWGVGSQCNCVKIFLEVQNLESINTTTYALYLFFRADKL